MTIGNRYVYMNQATGDTGGGGGGGYVPPAGEAFLNMIPPDMRGHTALAPIKDMPSLVKSFISAQSMVGADKVVLPKQDADDNAWGEFLKKIGLPETPDKYGIPKPDKLPEGFPYSDEDHKSFLEMAHKAGLTTRQANKFFSMFMDRGKGEFEGSLSKAKEAQQNFLNEFVKKHGQQQAEVKLSLAKQTVERLGGNELKKFFDETGLGDHPQMINLFVTLGELMANDKVVRDSFVNSGFVGNAQEAVQQIAQLMSDQNFQKEYLDGQHPNHRAAVEKMERLNRVAYPGKTS